MTTSTPYIADLVDIKAELLETNILVLTLNDPDKRNAISTGMIEAMETTLAKANFDANVRGVVLTGSGKAFCSGGDVKAMLNRSGMFAGTQDQLRLRYQSGIQRIPIAIHNFEKPIIAAINGAAIGAGLDLACMCDIRIASERAKFGETFTKLGLISGDGGGYFLQRVLGYAKALELTLTGEIIDAQTAHAIGLVLKVVSPELVLAEAIALAQKIATNSPLAIRHSKRLLAEAYHQTLESHLKHAALVQGQVQHSPEHQEGVNALLEKRSPRF